MLALFEDNLLTPGGGLRHHGEALPNDEDLSPTLENTIVLLWLQMVHPGLPQLVKQKFGVELRQQTQEISQALSSLQEEIRNIEHSKVLCIAAVIQTLLRW